MKNRPGRQTVFLSIFHKNNFLFLKIQFFPEKAEESRKPPIAFCIPLCYDIYVKEAEAR